MNQICVQNILLDEGHQERHMVVMVYSFLSGLEDNQEMSSQNLVSSSLKSTDQNVNRDAVQQEYYHVEDFQK